MDKRGLLAAAIMGLAATATNVQAAANCAAREALVDRLAEKYSEHLTARGLQSSEMLMEVFASADTGTFTVLMTNPRGLSCIVGAGTHFQLEEQKKKVAGIAG